MKNTILLMLSLLSLVFTSSFASVFTPLSTDIHLSDEIYNETPNLLHVNVKTVIEEGTCDEDDYEGCTLDDVNDDTEKDDNFKPEVNINFSADDFSADKETSNATLRIRGETSRYYDLKSYRIKLDSKKELWRDQRKLQLNKHIGDITRVKNKLSFDLMSTIPHLPSLRTQFVQLSIDNQNYGLFTHVENVGKEYLERRNFDENSNLYKAENFEFILRSELDIDEDGQPIDKEEFESVLEIKRGKDSKKLIEMLTAVNNFDNNFKNDVLNKYFNINNYLTWASVNALMGNSDIKTANFYIFNPKDEDTFYFLPWDYDQSWGNDWEENTIHEGSVPSKTHRVPHNLWVTRFGQRFLIQPKAIEQLKEAVTEIKNNYLTEAKINAFTESYYDIVFPLVSQEPDFDFITSNKPTDALTLKAYNKVYDALAETVERNYQTFLKDLESPMPFWLDKPVLVGDNIVFDWDKSIDLQSNKVTYHLEVSTTPLFEENDIKYNIKNIKKNHLTTKWVLPKGTYYFRITARDDDNPQENWQQAFNEFDDEELGKRVFGVEPFTINKDGVVKNKNSKKEIENNIGSSNIFFILIMTLMFSLLLVKEREKLID